jgi:hypothetical protein
MRRNPMTIATTNPLRTLGRIQRYALEELPPRDLKLFMHLLIGQLENAGSADAILEQATVFLLTSLKMQRRRKDVRLDSLDDIDAMREEEKGEEAGRRARDERYDRENAAREGTYAKPTILT